jgi:hypothetical protein
MGVGDNPDVVFRHRSTAGEGRPQAGGAGWGQNAPSRRNAAG